MSDQPPEPSPQREPTLRDVLTNVSFLRLWLAGICVGTMRWLEILAVGLYTLQETESAFLVALMYFARTGPTLVCGPLAGVLCERLPRKWLYFCGLLLATINSAVLAVLALSGSLALWQVAAGAVLTGVIWSLEHTARRTIARDVVGSQAIGIAISLDTSSQNATRMIGPLAGGALMAVIGIQGAYVLSFIFFAIATVAVLGLDSAFLPRAGRGASPLRGLLDVLRHAVRTPNLSAVFVVTVVMNLLGFPYVSMAPVIARDVIGLDAATTGVLLASEGTGAILAALILAFIVKRRHYARVFMWGSVLFMLSIQGFAHTVTFWPAAILLFISGFGLGGFAAMQSTILLTFAPPEMRARVMGLLVVTIGSGPIGVLILGGLAEWTGASEALALVSAIGILCLIYSGIRWPVLFQPTS